MKRALLTLAFAGLAACESPSAPPSREPTIAEPSFGKVVLNESFPIAGTLLNPCPPEEDVVFEGRLHVLIKGGPDNFTVHTNPQSIHGVGVTSGDRYELMENEHSEIQVTSTDETQLFNFRFRMIRQGREENFWFRVLWRFTFLPDGSVELEVIEEDIECRGSDPGTPV